MRWRSSCRSSPPPPASRSWSTTCSGPTPQRCSFCGSSLEPDGIAAPSRVRGVVAQRLGRLPADVNRVLDAASVIGREFAIDVLEPVSTLGEDDLLDALDAAVRAGVIRELPAAIGR